MLQRIRIKDKLSFPIGRKEIILVMIKPYLDGHGLQRGKGKEAEEKANIGFG